MQNDAQPGGQPQLPPSASTDEIGADFKAADDWRSVLARSERSGAVLPTLRNVVQILTMDEGWQGVLGFDEFSGRVMKRRACPFDVDDPGEWSDMDDARLRLWLAQKYGMEPKKEILMDAVHIVADANRYHDVREWLEGLKWDGIERLNYWLSAYLGAELTAYTQAAGRKWMIAAVARILRPGCKADNVLILEGLQGIGKSSALAAIGGDWYTDAPFRLGDKEGYMILRGRWIVELSELDSFNKAETSSAKLFFSQAVDRYRTPWGKRPADVPRQCVFAGSVNHDQYFRDDTGNRRYWPVRCTRADLPDLRADREQLFAEAMHAYQAGEVWHVKADEREMFEREQEQRYVGDAWESRVLAYLDERDNSGLLKDRVTMAQILTSALHLDSSKWTRPEQIRAGTVMRRLGWVRRRERIKGSDRLEWVYRPPCSVADCAAISTHDRLCDAHQPVNQEAAA